MVPNGMAWNGRAVGHPPVLEFSTVAVPRTVEIVDWAIRANGVAASGNLAVGREQGDIFMDSDPLIHTCAFARKDCKPLVTVLSTRTTAVGVRHRSGRLLGFLFCGTFLSV